MDDAMTSETFSKRHGFGRPQKQLGHDELPGAAKARLLKLVEEILASYHSGSAASEAAE